MTTATSSFTTPSLTSISSAALGLVTIGASHSWTTGDVVRFQGLTEMTELNGQDRVITVVNATTFTIGDTSSFDAETTGGADTCFIVVDVSGYLRTGVKGENVAISISGTYSSAVHLERAITRDATAWEKVYPASNAKWDTANATVVAVYQTGKDSEILRYKISDLTPTGTVAATLIDEARVIQEIKDLNGNLLITVTETGTTVVGTLAASNLSGSNTGD